MEVEKHFPEQNTLPVPGIPGHKQPLYLAHASNETVAQGRLASDLAPMKIARAIRIMLAKKGLPKKLLPIKAKLDDYKSPDYVYDTTFVRHTADRLSKVPFRKPGMKWIHEYNDGTMNISFYGVRDCDIDFDDFVRKVDISRVGDCFRDVLGINTQVLRTDDQDRPTLQIERIAALAQPNYSAFLGKDELDVYKLEWQEYEENKVINWMRTVCSPNYSTDADDSFMSVSRHPSGSGIQIEFVAFQSFPLPRIMVLLGLSRIKWFRIFLTEWAYRFFWKDTSDAMIKRYQGEEIGIGTPVHRETAAV